MKAKLQKPKPENKPIPAQKNAERFAKVIPISIDTLNALLKDILIDCNNSVINAKQFGEIINRSNDTVYRYAKDEIKFPIDSFATLIRETAARGDFRLLDLMLPEDIALMPIEKRDPSRSADMDVANISRASGVSLESLYEGKFNKAHLKAFEAKKAIVQLDLDITEEEKKK